jgi:hypothetical protein
VTAKTWVKNKCDARGTAISNRNKELEKEFQEIEKDDHAK